MSSYTVAKFFGNEGEREKDLVRWDRGGQKNSTTYRDASLSIILKLT